MLADKKLVAFVCTLNADRARAFYRDVLGLKLVHEDNFALAFDANGTMLRVTLARELTPAPFTVLGWEADDMAATVAELKGKGVEFLRFSFFSQDEHGIWLAPDGTQVAWFHDPDGNTLSLSKHA